MANTIAGTNLAAIAEETLPHLTATVAPLAGIFTDFSTDIKDHGESVTTRIPTVPTAVDLSSGYAEGDVVLTAKTITLDKFFGYAPAFTDLERSKSLLALDELFIGPCVEALSRKIVSDLWNLVVNANFSTNTVITAANFDRNDLADIGATMTTARQMKVGRTVWANPSYYAGLVKSLNAAEFPGQDANKAEGSAPRTAGFDCYELSDADANGENLGAFAFHRSSLLMAARSVARPPESSAVEVEDVVIPGLNLPVQFRRWYDPNNGKLRISVGLLYGVAVGNTWGVRVLSA